MLVNIFRYPDCRMVAENKYFSSRAAAENFCKYVAQKIWGTATYFFNVL